MRMQHLRGVPLCSAVLTQVSSPGAAWTLSPSWPAASVLILTQQTLNVKIPGRGRGREQQQYGLKQLNVVFHQWGGQLLTGKGHGLY